jgi:hypothetical protein
MKIRDTRQDQGNGAIKIDTHVPLPETRGRYPKYPWQSMKVGDSFLFPGGTNPQSCYNISKYAGLRTGHKFAARKTPEGYRCWRIA